MIKPPEFDPEHFDPERFAPERFAGLPKAGEQAREVSNHGLPEPDRPVDVGVKAEQPSGTVYPTEAALTDEETEKGRDQADLSAEQLQRAYRAGVPEVVMAQQRAAGDEMYFA